MLDVVVDPQCWISEFDFRKELQGFTLVSSSWFNFFHIFSILFSIDLLDSLFRLIS